MHSLDLLSQISKMFRMEISRVLFFGQSLSLIDLYTRGDLGRAMQHLQKRGMKNHKRSVTLYCYQKIAGLPLKEIAIQLSFSHYGSMSGLIAKFYR